MLKSTLRFGAIDRGQSSVGSLPVLFIHIQAGAVHGGDDVVEGDLPCCVEEARERDGTDRTHGGDGVPLDAGDLHKTADRVTGQAQIVLHGDLRGILDLIDVEL